MDTSQIVTAYQKAKRRLLLLDYDGTLAPIMPLPELAAPTPALRELLRKIASQPNTTCVIISGRPHETLDEWLGDLPVAFVAEHGLAWRDRAGLWEWNEDLQTDWKESVRPIFTRYARQFPDALVEEKAATIAFHYRNVNDPAVDSALDALEKELNTILQDHLLKLMKGKKVYEVMSNVASKGAAATAWYGKEPWDFVLAMGDDVTDEAMFEDLPPTAYTIKVGGEPSAATYRLASQPDAIDLLDQIVVS